MSETVNGNGKKFGTLAVFLTSISTILGAILFLRFGWAVGQTGLLGTLAIVFLGHLVTIPTALAIAEIATNQRVEGGGAYYIISRSFGLKIGSAIGIALFLSQAISVAFYVLAFAQSTGPIFDWIHSEFGIVIQHYDYRLVSIPAMALLALLVIYRGARSGMNLLYGVAAILGISLLMFFLGSTEEAANLGDWKDIFSNSFDPDDYTSETLSEFGLLDMPKEDFFYVFTIIFPAFTGIIAGLGLSGDLKEPSKAIPLGTLLATLAGMLIYIAVAFKFAFSLPPEILVDKNRLVMSDIAIWSPIIPIGLAAAAISSALGSILVAPRTLQALTQDRALPSQVSNNYLSTIRERDDEPVNATILTVVIASTFVVIGGLDFVAEIISMFFIVTYGAICLISFLEHFSGDPAYRPSFSSRWFFSLPGAILCLWLMFKMNTAYAYASIFLMVGIYIWVSRYQGKPGGMARIFQGVIFQISRSLRVMLQKSTQEDSDEEYWVPSVVSISDASFERQAAFDMVRFISYKYGFGTYIHLERDYYSKASVSHAKTSLTRLLKRTQISKSNVFVDTLISPSYTSALAQVLQIPGISGQDNNMILFEYYRKQFETVQEFVNDLGLVRAASFDLIILQSSEKGFGYRREIHLWLSTEDYVNGNLMILLAYILLGHPEWSGGMIKIFAVYPEAELKTQKDTLLKLIEDGRLAISPNNVQFINRKEEVSIKTIINETSVDADLTLIGFRYEAVKRDPKEVFDGYDKLGNVLFVNTQEAKLIS